MQGEELPKDCFDAPDPYASAPKEKYLMRAMVNYLWNTGRAFQTSRKRKRICFLVYQA